MRRLFPPDLDAGRLFRHGGAPTGRPGILDFSTGINPLGPPPAVQGVLRRAFAAVAHYPDPDSSALCATLARLHRLAAEQIVPGNGSLELIHALPRAIRPRRVAIVEPTFTEYLRASRLVGASVTHWLPDDDLFQPQRFDPEGADLLWLCNPNNPTGRLWPAETLSAWIRSERRTLFVVDEAYLPFLEEENEQSLVGLVRAGVPNVVVLRSLTKIYALPGLRLGYAVASPELAARLRAQLPPWSVNALAQAAGMVALQDSLFLPATHAWLDAHRNDLLEQLRDLAPALQAIPSRANFLLLRSRLPAPLLADRLAEKDVLVRDASNFVGLDDYFLRMAVRTADEHQRLVTALRSVVA
jgi:threonine-phosphate decarboxylase